MIHFLLKISFPLLLFSIFAHACYDKEALKQALIAETVQKGVENHRNRMVAKCRKEALEEAITLADSMIIKMQLASIDTTNKISRPVKPIRPEIIIPNDTTPIAPLFEDTLLVKKDSTTATDSLENNF